jgi:tetratricopeptide (TPR) repeat protein
MLLSEAVESARQALAAGDTNKALAIWDAAAKSFPEEAVPLLGRGDVLWEMKLLDEAEAVFIQAAERFPDNLWANLKVALIAAHRQDWVEAFRRSKALLDRFPDASEGHVSLGAALREAGRLDEADAILEAAVARFPEALWAAVHYALVAVHRQDWLEALRRWDLVRCRFPEVLSGYLGCAQTCCRLGQFEQADAIFRDAASRIPGDLETAIQLADVAMDLGRCDVAAEQWRNVRLQFPDQTIGYVRGADALRRIGRVDEADDVVQLALRRFPTNEQLMIEAVRLALLGGDRPRALCRWRELTACCPARNNDLSRDRTELRKQLALSHPRFDFRALDLDRRLTGTILSEDPLIIFSAGPGFDVIEAVAPYYQGRTVYFFMGVLWTIAHYDSYAREYKERFDRLSHQYPTFKITVLANDVDELFAFRDLGISAELVNHNAFVDENVFAVLPVVKEFDAIYNARITGYKRHDLARGIGRLKLITADATEEEIASIRQVLARATIANETSHGIVQLTPREVAYHLNSAKCGLCLSSIEGAMFASMEYLLCGLPIVTTRNVGGRNWFFSDDFAVFCDDVPEAVAQSVDLICGRNISPHYIRESTRERIKRERAVFFKLIENVFRENDQGSRKFEIEFNRMFFDKINYVGRQTGDFLVPFT